MYKQQNFQPQSLPQQAQALPQSQGLPYQQAAQPQARYTQPHEMGNLCKSHLHRYVLLQTKDGKSYDGIIEHVDEQNAYLAVPIGPMDTELREEEWNEHDEDNLDRNEEGQDQRQFYGGYGSLGGYPGYGYPGYGFPGYGYPGYGYPRPGFFRPRRRRFQRQILPLAALAALSLLPYYY